MAELNAAAPKITDRLCEACAEHFAGGPRAPRRARDRATSSIRPSSAASTTTRGRRSSSSRRARAGQQSALGGGGRYDGLVELLGGRPTPGIGFGVGLDRVLLALEAEGVAAPAEPGPLAVVVGADPAATAERLRVATELRAAGLAVRADLGRAEARPPARGGVEGGRPLRGHPRRRARRRPGPAQGPPGRHAAGRRDGRPGARAVARQRLPPPRLNPLGGGARHQRSARYCASAATPKNAWEPW